MNTEQIVLQKQNDSIRTLQVALSCTGVAKSFMMTSTAQMALWVRAAWRHRKYRQDAKVSRIVMETQANRATQAARVIRHTDATNVKAMLRTTSTNTSTKQTCFQAGRP